MAGLPTALAEDIDTDPSPDALQQEIERTAQQLEDARAQVEQAEAAVEENAARIADLEEQIRQQQERSDGAVVQLYKLSCESYGAIDLLLGADDLTTFLLNYEYLTHVTEANLAEVRALNDLHAQLEDAQDDLQQAVADAEARQADAEKALAQAQEARAEAQRRAEEEARRQAEQQAIAQAAEAAARAEEQRQAEQAAAEGGETPELAPAPSPEETASEIASAAAEASDAAVEAISDGADWNSDEEAFVAEWAPRIDAYLAGSPLAGQGRTFAVAAWTYGVDPRWSPAISNTESSKGAACFLPHNAWGWGSVSWDSWEEAIDEHVRGLARGYGYTISLEAAAKYCPPNYEHWYEVTLAQMNLI